MLAFSAGSAFVASGQQDADTYYGCLSGTGGLTKVSINETPTCPGAYTLISWNAEGVQGPVGPQGEQGIQGEPGLTWQGEWAAGTAYVVDDAVSYQGSSYVAIAASTGEAPGSGTSWDLLAQKGDTGEQGPQGIQGEQGEPGPQGPAGTFSGMSSYFGAQVAVASQSVGTGRAECPAGKIPVTGGWSGTSGMSVYRSYKPIDFNGWEVVVYNPWTSSEVVNPNITFSPWVMCIDG